MYCTFGEIYEAITEGVFGVCNVRVYVGKGNGKQNNLREGLYDDITLMSELELKYIRFIVHTEENNIVQQNQQFERNAFPISHTFHQLKEKILNEMFYTMMSQHY